MQSIIRTSEQLDAWVERLCQAKEISIDFEMTGLDPRSAVMLIAALSDGENSCAIDVRAIGTQQVFNKLAQLSKVPMIAHNATLEYKFLYHYKAAPERMFCTMIAEQVLSAGMSFTVSAGLASVAERYLDVQMEKDTRKEFINNPTIVLQDYHFEYAMKDVAYLHKIKAKQLEKVEKHGLTRVMDLESAIIPVTSIMEHTGIACNRDELESFIPVLEKLVKRAYYALQDLFIANGAVDRILVTSEGYIAVNLNAKGPRKDKSTKEKIPGQLQEALHNVGVDVPSLGKKELLKWDIKNSGGTDEDVDYAITDDDGVNEAIAQYEGLKNVYLRALSFYTAASKLLSSAVIGTLEKIHPETNRVHFWFKQVGAKATGRYSSDGQQLPKNDKLSRIGIDKSIRETLVAAKGRKLLIADFAGIELYELADFSNDEKLIHECTIGDIHLAVVKACGSFLTPLAMQINDKNKKDGVFKLLRDGFKTVSYSVAYGTTEYNLSETLSINLAPLGIKVSVDDGKQILHIWKHELFPQAGAYLNSVSQQAITKGYTTSALGRKRWYDLEFAAGNKWAMFAIMREASNQPMQSTCVDMMKLAMLDIYQRMDYNRARIVLTVHDELVIESTERYADTAAEIMRSAMENAARQLLPIMGQYVKVDVGISDKYDK